MGKGCIRTVVHYQDAVRKHQEIIICLKNRLFSLEMLKNSFKAIKAFSRQIKGFKTFKTIFSVLIILMKNMVLKVLKPLICLGNPLIALKLFSSISRENKSAFGALVVARDTSQKKKLRS
jgi:hypothetical protein